MDEKPNNWLKIVLTALAIGGVGFFVLFIFLEPIFSGSLILPRNINLFGLHIQYYGLILGAAALLGYWLSVRRAPVYEIKSEDLDTIIFIVLVCGFIGARLYHVVSSFGYYLQHPAQIIAVWNGGLGIFGAGIGGIIGLLAYIKFSKKYSLIQLLDWLTPAVVLGQAIGRFGNFFNYELYGYPTNLPWKMFVPEQFRLPGYEQVSFYHPLFLYEAMGSLVIFIILIRINPRTGHLFLLWLFLYNGLRFFLEFIRLDSVFHAGIRMNAVVAFGLAILAIILYVKQNSHNR